MCRIRASIFAVLAAFCLISMSGGVLAQTSILNVSYDVSRELYRDINPAFIAAWKAKTGEAVTVNQSTAHLEFLFSPQGQEIIAKHALRPRDEAVLQRFAGRFPAIRTFSVEQTLGSWAEVQVKHFADGAIYDQIVVKR